MMNDDPQSVVYISPFCFYVTLSPPGTTQYIFHTVMTQYSLILAKAVIQSLRPESWSRGASRTKNESVGLGLEHLVLVLVSVLKKKFCSILRLLL